MSNDLLWLHIFQIELQAAREHRRRQLLRISCRQQKQRVRRRFFKGFEQCVKAVIRQHMHFINEINFIARSRGRVLDVFQ